MATARRLRLENPTDPELGIRVFSPTTQPKDSIPINVSVKKERVEPSGQEILLKNMFRKSPMIGVARRTKVSRKSRKARKTRKHR